MDKTIGINQFEETKDNIMRTEFREEESDHVRKEIRDPNHPSVAGNNGDYEKEKELRLYRPALFNMFDDSCSKARQDVRYTEYIWERRGLSVGTLTLTMLEELMFTPSNVNVFNALQLQSIAAAVSFRIAAEEELGRLTCGGDFIKLWRADGGEWEHAILYEIVHVSPFKLILQAVDPLVYLEGSEFLRVVRLNRSVAVDVASEQIGYHIDHVAQGDLVWVYKLGAGPNLAEHGACSEQKMARWSTRNYLASVKKGECVATAFQVHAFSFVQPHSEMQDRIAWIKPYQDNHSNHVIVEGEKSTGRTDGGALKRLGRHTSNGVIRATFRPALASLPHFSAPLKDPKLLGRIIEMLEETGYLTLMPERLGLREIRATSQNIRDSVKRRVGDNDGCELGVSGWEDEVELFKLGVTIERVELLRYWDTASHFVIFEVEMIAATAIVGRVLLMRSGELRNAEQGWTSGMGVLARLQGGEWTRGTIISTAAEQRDGIVELKVEMSFVPSALLKPDDPAPKCIELEVKLDVESAPLPQSFNKLQGRALQLSPDSASQRALSTVYRASLAEDKQAARADMLPLVNLVFVPRRTGAYEWGWLDRAVMAHGTDENMPILCIESGAGCGKTTTAAGAVDYTHQKHGPRTFVICTAVTNGATANFARKCIDVCNPETTKVLRVTAALLGDANETSADVLRKLIVCADNSSAPRELKTYGCRLKEMSGELQRLLAAGGGETRDAKTFDRVALLRNQIEKHREAATAALLEHLKPNCICLTIDKLLLLMGGESALRQYITTAERLFIWIDESSQVPELDMAALFELFPDAPQRYLGDPRQLEPFHLNGCQWSLAKALQGEGVAAALLASRYTPRLRLFGCRRMHPQLLEIVSYLFYRGKLTTRLKASDRAPPPTPLLRNASTPLCVIAVKGEEEKVATGSRRNREQELMAVKVIRHLRTRFFGDNIAIVSFYKEPVMRIADQEPDIKAKTVDSVQGDEFDAIVILTTRTDPNGCIDYLEDRKRANVSLTRARRAIFVVGDGDVLRSARYWDYVFDVALNKDNVFTSQEAEWAMR